MKILKKILLFTTVSLLIFSSLNGIFNWVVDGHLSQIGFFLLAVYLLVKGLYETKN